MKDEISLMHTPSVQEHTVQCAHRVLNALELVSSRVMLSNLACYGERVRLLPLILDFGNKSRQVWASRLTTELLVVVVRV